MTLILAVYCSGDGIAVLYQKLKEASYPIYWLNSPLKALEYCIQNPVSLVLAADNLEFMNGHQLLAAIKAVRSNIVTVLCTSDLDDNLEMSALKARIDTILDLNRSERLNWEKLKQYLDDQNLGYQIIESNGICMNIQSHSVTQFGVEVELTIREFEFLEFFIRNKNRALTRSEIVESLWDTNVSPLIDGRTVDVHVKRLRDKLGRDALVSVRGIGYKWKE